MTTTVIFLTSPTGSNQTWTVPEDWNSASNTIEVFGAGGSGGATLSGSTLTAAASGGGGGGYSKISNLSLTAGGSVTYQIGGAGAAVSEAANGVVNGNAGGATWFNGTTLGGSSVGASGGGGGTGSQSNSPSIGGGAGGTVSTGSGSSGGAGGSISVSGVTTAGSGGGGAAGPHGAGNSGVAVTLTEGGNGGSGDAGSGGAAGVGAGTGGGNGSAGGTSAEYTSNPGGATAGPGGGGGGAAESGTAATWTAGAGGNYGAGGGGAAVSQNGAIAAGGAGAPGLIVITYTPLPIQTSALLAGAGSLAAITKQVAQSTSHFAGAGALSVSASQIAHVAAAFAGAGALSVAAPSIDSDAAQFAGSGALLNAIASKTVNVLGHVLSGAGALTAHAEILNAAYLAGDGIMTVDAQLIARPVIPSTADQWVRRTAADYTQGLAGLLPNGIIWGRQPDSVMMTALGGLMGIFGYFDTLAGNLLDIESDPRSTVEMLPDWNRNFGLPDACAVDEQLSIADQQVALVQKMTTQGGQSRAYFIAAAARIGYTITITEYSPFMAGVSNCGDTRDAQGDYRWQIGPPSIRFYWSVNVGQARLTWFRAGAGGGQAGVDPMLIIGLATDLECMINRWKPGHTLVIFNYSGLETGGQYAGTP